MTTSFGSAIGFATSSYVLPLPLTFSPAAATSVPNSIVTTAISTASAPTALYARSPFEIPEIPSVPKPDPEEPDPFSDPFEPEPDPSEPDPSEPDPSKPYTVNPADPFDNPSEPRESINPLKISQATAEPTPTPTKSAEQEIETPDLSNICDLGLQLAQGSNCGDASDYSVLATAGFPVVTNGSTLAIVTSSANVTWTSSSVRPTFTEHIITGDASVLTILDGSIGRLAALVAGIWMLL